MNKLNIFCSRFCTNIVPNKKSICRDCMKWAEAVSEQILTDKPESVNKDGERIYVEFFKSEVIW